MMIAKLKSWSAASRIGLFLFLLSQGVFENVALAQVYQISATVTVTNAPVTNGCKATVNSDTRTATNNVLLNPAIYWLTNSTKNGAATNFLNHATQYRFANIRATYDDTNAVRLTARIGDSLSVTIGGFWASVTYHTNQISTPYVAIVRTPATIEAATNQTNIANMLMAGLGTNAATPPITNYVSLSTSNATVKPLLSTKNWQLLPFYGLQAGADIVLSMTDTSVVITSTGVGITNINGLTDRSQWMKATSTGTDFTITTRTGTTGGSNIFDLPTAAAAVTGKLGSNDFRTFRDKMPGSTILTNLSGTSAHTNPAILIYRGPTNSSMGAPLILKAGTGMSASTNGSNFVLNCTLSPVGIPDFTNQVTRWFLADGHTNLVGVGDYASTNGLSNASKYLDPDGTSGPRVQWDGSGTITTTNGFAGQKLYHVTFNPQMATRFAITNSSDNFRAWIGFTDTTFGEMMESKTPTGLTIAAFRHWDDASTWYAVTSSAGSYEANDTGVTHDGASHLFDVRLDSNVGGVVFYIDGVPKMTNVTQVPQFNPVALRPIVQFRNISDGHDLQCEWLRVRSDR